MLLDKVVDEGGWQKVVIRLKSGEEVRERIREVDLNNPGIVVGRGKTNRRLISCADVSKLELEPKARRKRRRSAQVLFSTLTLPVGVALLYGSGGSAAAFVVWPGGLLWGWPAGRVVVPRRTESYILSCP